MRGQGSPQGVKPPYQVVQSRLSPPWMVAGPFLTARAAGNWVASHTGAGGPSPPPPPGSSGGGPQPGPHVPAPKPGSIARRAAALVAEALKFRGNPYVWGGARPDPGWDCSGFINWLLGRALGITLPGGIRGFDGSVHGPVVADYAAWTGAVTVTTPVPGDLVIWWWPGVPFGGHIGLYVGGGRMISALDPSDGTIVTPVGGAGPSGQGPQYRRILALAHGSVPLVSTGQVPSVAIRLALLLGAVVVVVGGGVIVAGIVVAGVAGRPGKKVTRV